MDTIMDTIIDTTIGTIIDTIGGHLAPQEDHFRLRDLESAVVSLQHGVFCEHLERSHLQLVI